MKSKSQSTKPMKTECTRWKDALLNAALSGSASAELEDHLSRCPECARDLAQLRTRQQQIDSLLPRVVHGDGPQPGFETRVLAAAAALDVAHQRRSPKPWMRWALVGAIAALVIVLAVHSRTAQIRSQEEWTSAQKLAQWRAPSDVLLQFPGQEFMRTTPELGESYLNMSLRLNKEK